VVFFFAIKATSLRQVLLDTFNQTRSMMFTCDNEHHGDCLAGDQTAAKARAKVTKMGKLRPLTLNTCTQREEVQQFR
jgi:hypothetical protein